jgi:HSP20 family protein
MGFDSFFQTIKLKNMNNTKANPNIDGLINNVFQFGFDKFFRDDFVTGQHAAHTPVNILETEQAYELEMVAPGREKNDFQVQLKEQVLTISCEKKATDEAPKALRREFRIEGFKRSFTLNDKVDATGITAQYVNGILKLVLPKKEDVKVTPATIAVQ